MKSNFHHITLTCQDKHSWYSHQSWWLYFWTINLLTMMLVNGDGKEGGVLVKEKKSLWKRRKRCGGGNSSYHVFEFGLFFSTNKSTKSAYISTRRYTASAHGDQEQSKRRIKREGNEQGGEKKRWRRMMTRRLPVWCSNFWNYLSLKVVSYEECKRKFLNLIIFLNNRQNQRISNGWWHSALLKLPLRTLSLLSTRHNAIHSSS